MKENSIVGLTVTRMVRGRIYRRKVTDYSLITSTEAQTKIGITLRYLYYLVEMGKLHCVKKKGRLFFKYGEVKKFASQGR
jgi:hypothetical protein